MSKREIEVNGVTIKIEENNFVSLTDIAKQVSLINLESAQEPRFIIRNWLRNAGTLAYIETWETLHNPNFNRAEAGTVRLKAINNTYSPTPQKFIEETNAIGLKSKAGKYGGTYAHEDIAINFCYWLSPVFQVYFIKEFRRLKQNEKAENTIDWAIKKLADSTQQNAVLLDMLKEIRKNQALKSGREKKF